MERKVIITKDGSSSIYLPEWDEHYHSIHGAIQEAYHVFIKNGLTLLENRGQIKLLEMGFGTGLNAFITLIEGERKKMDIDYTGLEAFPVSLEQVKQLNYVNLLKAKSRENDFIKMHEGNWEEKLMISELFHLTKRQQKFESFSEKNSYDLIYYDAFGARVQPELWTENVFKKMFEALKEGGILVTYAAKGSVRRAMLTSGFDVEKLPGPPGKREMLRAIKPRK
ncbi:tRNA (5-methylaminomethyl-2-thiouridine)(34)-methyltransferase MnmD [Namhaeicola litoreus]|uniref:tRNA (5-methylaminomethyl-2-thiouridine)(34)-methyltransferase MnmD n=1 Tax=Namhaeicola litoreus TaxID=1052145 RepID=A0ABW3XYW8_9FLAO